MAYTTQQIVEKTHNLQPYQKLMIKRRYSETVYETNWLDITKYLVDKGQANISYKLDNKKFGWGKFSVSSASFKLNNIGGWFLSEKYPTSLFKGMYTRHYTKVYYEAGYLDETGTQVQEKVFEGLLNERSINPNISGNTISIEAQSYGVVLADTKTVTGQMSGAMTLKNIVASLFSDTFITQYITYNASNINPSIDQTFDGSGYFNDKKIDEVLTDICQKGNSVWFINANNEIIITSKQANAGTPYPFIGGAIGSNKVNIIEISDYDEGYSNIINFGHYESGSNNYFSASTSSNLKKYGSQEIKLEGADMTDTTRIYALLDAIIDDNDFPRRRIKIKTIYMPNVIGIFDKATITYYGNSFSSNVFFWNRSKWNSNQNYLILGDGFILDGLTEWFVIGYEYKTGDTTMTIELIENI